MEKNLSIIQGLTSADQANPVRITDAGELKVAVTDIKVAVNGDPLVDPSTGGTAKYVNTIAGAFSSNSTMFEVNVMDGAMSPGTPITNSDKKLLVEQGKQFASYYTLTMGAGSDGDVDNAINTAINNWINSYGERYDDIKITSILYGAAGPASINVTIIRYF